MSVLAMVGDSQSAVLMAEWVLLRHAEKDTWVPIQESPKYMFTSHWLQWDGQRYRNVLLSLQAKQSGQSVRAVFSPALHLLKMAT